MRHARLWLSAPRQALWLAFIGSLLPLLVMGVGALGSASGGAVVTTAARSGALLVADTVAETLYVFSLPDLTPTGQLDHIRLGAHMGTLALPDGRILLVDDRNVEFLTLRIDAAGRPVIAGRAAIPAAIPWNRAAWGAVDHGLRYVAVSSDTVGGAMQTVTLIDLDDYTVGQVELALNQNRHGDFEEVHVYLAGNPLHLFVTTGEEVRAYRVASVLTGTLGAPVSTLAIRPNSHGPAIAHGSQRLYSATADGLAVLDLVGAHLQGPRLVPWDVDGVTAGQNFRPRLSFDNSAIYGAVIGTNAPALDPSQWAAQQNYIHAVDLRTETARLLPLAPGVVGRFSLSRPYALFWNIHPDGDHAYLLDIDPSSPTFQQMVMSVPLTPLSHGPVAGEPTTGKEARTGTITPDGRWAFVSHGGDGVISVIATAARRVTTMLSLPTPLSGGGYLVAVQLGMPLLDMHAR